VAAVLLAPFQKILVQFSVCPVIVGRDEADDCRVRELLQGDVVRVVIEVRGVDGEEEWSQNGSLWSPRAAGDPV